MKRTSVSSSNLVSVGYDSNTSILEIEFNNGIYQHYDVPESIYDELMASCSLGSYYHHNIKNVFRYSKV